MEPKNSGTRGCIVKNHVRRLVLLTVTAALLAAILHAVVLSHLTAAAAARSIEQEDRRQVGACIRGEFSEHLDDSVFEELRSGRPEPETVSGLRAVLDQHGGFRIKVYDLDGTILWSDEPRLIGRSFPDNDLILSALKGEVVSKVEEPSRTEHVYERDAAGSVTETYVPIISPAGRVLGVVEVYRHSDETMAAIAHVRHVVWIGAAVASVLLCAALAMIVAFGQQRVEGLQGELIVRGNELAEEKSKLEAVVEGVGVGLALIGRDHRILWTNRKMAEWAETSNGLVGEPCHRACWGRDLPCEECPSQVALASGREARAERTRVLAGGRERRFELVAWPMRDASGRITHSLELVQDVTELTELQAQLQQAAKLAAVGELAGGVAHEVNNPTGVIMATATHLTSRAPPGWGEDLEVIRTNAGRISQITRALLDFSRRSKGTKQRVSLNQIVHDALPLVRQRLGAGIELRVELDDPLPVVKGNANEIQQVLLNLTNNACDAMPGKGRLRITTRRDGPDIVLEVADTGDGIPRDLQQRIFDPFFTTKPPGEGTGLGLAVSQGIVAAHDGRISVFSTAGRTVFRVVLPAALQGAAS